MEWIKAISYTVENMKIHPAGEIVITSYSPFYYYQNPIPEEIATAVLAGAKGIRPLYIHTLFLSLRFPDELCQFANHFGLPYYRSNGTESGFEVQDIEISIPVKEIFNEIKALRLLLSFFHAAEQKNIEQLKDLYPEVTENEIITGKISNIPSWEVYDNEDILLSARNLISEALSSTLEGVSPSFEYDQDTPPAIDWNCKNLLSAIYLMVSLDMAEGKAPLFCQNDLCGRVFSPSKGVVRYCSQTCQTRVKARKYKQRKKKED